ncbi:MAG: alcohol dehydrogenase catalytic domain-containing protein [Streptosporangiales bacterium]
MKAVVFTGTREVATAEVADATLEESADVLLRVTSSAVCGTDLHMYDGRTGATPGLVLGHEPLGVVAEAGPAVEMVEPGDRVVIPTHLYCGVCVNCARGLSAACLRVRPGGFGAAYGYAGMGPYRGAQAELLRVPFADANCVRVPGEPGDELGRAGRHPGRLPPGRPGGPDPGAAARGRPARGRGADGRGGGRHRRGRLPGP